MPRGWKRLENARISYSDVCRAIRRLHSRYGDDVLRSMAHSQYNLYDYAVDGFDYKKCRRRQLNEYCGDNDIAYRHCRDILCYMMAAARG